MKFPKIKLPTFHKPSILDILKWAQYGTYVYIVVRIVIHVVQQLAKLRFKRK